MNVLFLCVLVFMFGGFFSGPHTPLRSSLKEAVSLHGVSEFRRTVVIHVRATFGNRSRLDVGEGRASIFGGPSDTSASGGKRARLALGGDPERHRHELRRA